MIDGFIKGYTEALYIKRMKELTELYMAPPMMLNGPYVNGKTFDFSNKPGTIVPMSRFLARHCSYCKSTYSKDSCPNCGAPNE